LLPAALPFLQTFFNNSGNNADQLWEWLVSMRKYGLALGSLASIYISIICGRKWPITIGMIIQLIGGVMCLFIKLGYCGIVAAFIGRFLNGFGSAILQTIGVSMMSEIPSVYCRGRVLASNVLWACAGELFGFFIGTDYALGTEQLWPIALFAPLALLPCCVIILYISAESPRFFILRDKIKEAKQSLKFYQVNLFRISIIPHKNPTKLILTRFSSGTFLKPLLIALFTQCFVHIDDWLWITYSTQAFINFGYDARTSQITTLLMAIPAVFISISLVFYFESFTRRSLLIAPTIGSILCSLLQKIKKIAIPILASIDLCMAALASESAYTVVPELFRLSDRTFGISLVIFLQNVYGGLLTTVILSIMNSNGLEYILIPLIVNNYCYILGIYFFLPETSGKTFKVR
uniref:MFS domain-containing protein n=1 Tax=Dracunculus medinensis TaxID=318479 RepID=A0A0N4UC41_DRAME